MSIEIKSLAEKAAKEAVDAIEFLTIVEIAEEDGIELDDAGLNDALELARSASVKVEG